MEHPKEQKKIFLKEQKDKKLINILILKMKMDNGSDPLLLKLYIVAVHHHLHHHLPLLQFLKFKKLLEKPRDKKLKLKKIISNQKLKTLKKLN